MTFLNPIGLAGLLALPVILALHLLNRRKQRYVVSHLGLWSFLDAEISGPRARRIPLTWILLLDLLLAALLSLAWARPSLAIPQPGHAPRHLVILLDVSSSMLARDGAAGAGLGETRFVEAKSAVNDLLRDSTSKDIVTIIGFGRQARVIADTRDEVSSNAGGGMGMLPVTGALVRAQDSGALLARIDQAQSGETGSDLPEALALGQSLLDPTLPAEFDVITDGAFPLADPGSIERFSYPLRWHFIGAPADNQAVLNLTVTLLGRERAQVFTRLANFGSQPVIRQLSLSVDGQAIKRGSINLPGNSSVPQVWQIALPQAKPAGSVTVALDGSDALPADDAAVIGLPPGGKVRVALVAANPVPIQQALQAIPDVDVRVLDPASYPSAVSADQPPFDLTIFRGALPSAWPAGQVMVIDLPSAGGDSPLRAGPERAIPSASLTQASADNPLVAGIDFSGVRWGSAWSLTASPAGLAPLLQAGDTPILLQGMLARPAGGQAQVTVLLADLAQGNFIHHPAYPILMANLVELARQSSIPLEIKTGQALPLPVPGSYQVVQITPPQGSPVILRGSWPESWGDTLVPGLYHLTLTAANGSQLAVSTGARAGDADESNLSPRDWTRSISGQQNRAANGSEPPFSQQSIELSGWLLGAALLVFLLEAALAWRR